MNIALRKLALLEKEFIAQEEFSKTEGYSTKPIDRKLQEKVYDLMRRVRAI